MSILFLSREQRVLDRNKAKEEGRVKTNLKKQGSLAIAGYPYIRKYPYQIKIDLYLMFTVVN